MLYRVRVQGTTQDGEPWKRSLIYKCLPDNPTRRQAFKSDVLFRNEVAFYTQALPVLLEFQVSATCPTWQRSKLFLHCIKHRHEDAQGSESKYLSILKAAAKLRLSSAGTKSDGIAQSVG
jgi:hypothetical protein